MTEEQKYRVEQRFPHFEVRRYDPCVVADVRVSGNFESAGNRGFGPLFGYISGSNKLNTKIAMTAPVVQEPGSKIAMTSPVVQQHSDAGNTISFVMPAHMTLDSLPIPTNPDVSLRSIPEQLVAVKRFTGRWTQENCQKHLAELTQDVHRHGYVATGSPRFARFNPPWTPWMLRRNEIQLPVELST